jgi:HSP20 family molecular chaperone IbpA
MKKIKSLLFSKITAVAAIIVLGALATFAYAKSSKEKKDEGEIILHSDFEKSFFGSEIFSEMEAMQKHMNKIFEEQNKMMKKIFDDSQKNFSKSDSSTSLSLRKEKEFYIYELNFSSFNKDDVSIAVDGRILTIAANTAKSGVAGSSESYQKNNFYYSLSLPSDASNVPEITREKDRITVKFMRLRE